jgi:predicted phage terminase large subunit-like protein
MSYQTTNYAPLSKIKAAAILEYRRRQEVTAVSFSEFVTSANRKYQWYPHVRQLADVLQRVADGELSRVMVFMPPRHGKSELVSRLFSGYYLYRYPDRWVGLNSYGADLSYTFSRTAKDNYLKMGGQVRGDVSAVKHWETGKGGGMWAAGVGGPITGKGAHLAIIDDPIKNAEEAHSETIRAKHQDWYDSTLYTRLEPGASIIVIQTRWHENDLSGYLLDNETEEPESWHIVHFEAIKEEDIPTYPASCTLEPDGRQIGEALAPERYTKERLNKIAGRIGSYFWAALYQQRPAPREGGMFKREWFEIVDRIPYQGRFVRYWDKAGTKDAGAYTAGVLIAKHDGAYYIVDVVMGQWEATERERVIRQTAQTDKAAYGRVETGVEQEPGSGGKESAQNTIRVTLDGFTAYADRPTGDKELRAEPFAAQCAIRNVKLVKGHWNGRYLDILTMFPNGKIKDPVDASSAGFARLATGGKPGSAKYA